MHCRNPSGDPRRNRGEEASCAQVDRNEASDIKLAPVPVDISIYLYLLTSNMCNVPAPLRRRHDGGTGTPPFSRLRCSAARERVRVVPPRPSPPCRAPSNPRRWCNTQRLLCDITRWARASDKRFTVAHDGYERRRGRVKLVRNRHRAP